MDSGSVHRTILPRYSVPHSHQPRLPDEAPSGRSLIQLRTVLARPPTNPPIYPWLKYPAEPDKLRNSNLHMQLYKYFSPVLVTRSDPNSFQRCVLRCEDPWNGRWQYPFFKKKRKRHKHKWPRNPLHTHVCQRSCPCNSENLDRYISFYVTVTCYCARTINK